MSALTRRATLVTSAITGVVVGVVATMALTDPGTPKTASGAESDQTTTTGPSRVESTATSSPLAGDGVLLVWTSGGLPAGFAETIQALDGVEQITTVRGDEIGLTASTDADGRSVDTTPPGWHIPLDTLAIDPNTFAPFLNGDAATTVGSLAPGQALLTQTSARLRRLSAGATIRLDHTDLTVAGVIDDRSGAGAELVVTAGDAELLGVTTARYVLVSYAGDREQLQQAIAATLDGRAVRFRSPGETTWLRHGDAVEPAANLKVRFGEFAVRDLSGRDVEIDPDYIERWIVTEPVPILGPVTCHRRLIDSLRAAMTELEQANLSHLVDAPAFAGCFAARRIAAGQPLSHHAWGAALDLNVRDNPRGSFSTQDPRLVEAMASHGFTWGGTWLVPDPAHYEAAGLHT